jgi:hypothetical protein
VNAFLTNAKQLAEQVKANRELTIGKNIVNMYWKDKILTEKLLNAEKLFNLGQTNDCINEVEHIVNLAKDTLTYYRRYQTNRFMICLVFMWIGWITFLFFDLSGIQRQTIQLEYYSWILLINLISIIVIIFLIIEYKGNTLFDSIIICLLNNTYIKMYLIKFSQNVNVIK